MKAAVSMLSIANSQASNVLDLLQIGRVRPAVGSEPELRPAPERGPD